MLSKEFEKKKERVKNCSIKQVCWLAKALPTSWPSCTAGVEHQHFRPV